MSVIKRCYFVILFVALIYLPQKSFQATDKVVCYLASWATHRPGNGKFNPEDVNPNRCTHLNYAFLGLNHNGSLQILDPAFDVDQGGFRRASDLKKTNPKLKVLFSVGGAAADTGAFSTVAADAGKRDAMARSALELIELYNFDGVDVDWEYPRGGDQQKFIDLLATLRASFEPHGLLVTVAVNSIPGEVGGYDIPAMSKILDIINVMTYDFHAIWGPTAQNSPLYGGDQESDWQKENRNADAAITQWIRGGADPQKLTIGVAFYGHTYTLSDATNHGLGAPTAGPWPKGPYTDNPGSLGYNELCEFHPKGKVFFQNDMQVPYLYDDKLWAGFDNAESVALKTQYAQEKNLAGVMIWSIDTDDKGGFCGKPNALLEAINEQIHK